MSDLQVACNLMPAELQERRRNVLSKIRDAVSEVTELDDGFKCRFASDTLISELGSMIHLEHRCCPFLTFRLTVEPGDSSVSLDITGPEGTKEFLTEIFGLDVISK